MIVGLALMLGLLVAWALGARLTNLSHLAFRGEWLVFIALGIQVSIFAPWIGSISRAAETELHVASYLMLLAFMALNMRLPGFWMVGGGAVLNTVVIFLNGGLMPVSLGAWKAAGADPHALLVHGSDGNNVLATARTHLAFLGDIFALPGQVPFSNALSVGDVLIVLGSVAFVYRACSPPSRPTGRMILAPLRYPQFRRMIAGRMTSKLGDWLSQAAVVTWIYADTHSTPAVSAYLIARIGSFTLGGFAAAPLLARIQGFRILSAVELLRGIVTLAALPFAVTGQVWPVMALGCVSSFLSISTVSSASSLVVDVLPGEMIVAGNALHGVARNFTLVLGAGLGGFLVAHFGIGTALLTDVATFLLSAALYKGYAARPLDEEDDLPADGPTRRELIHTLLTNRVVMALTASFTIATAAIGILNSSIPRVFDLQLGDPTGYGYALAILGCGFMVGELLTGFMERESVARRSVGLSFVAQAGMIFVVAHSDVTATVLLMLFLLGASDGTTEIVYDTLVQIHTPRRHLAGVFAVARSVQNAGMIIGLAVAPVLVGSGTAVHALLISALACTAAATLAALGLVGKGAAAESVMVLPTSHEPPRDNELPPRPITTHPPVGPIDGRGHSTDARMRWCLSCQRSTIHSSAPDARPACTECTLREALTRTASLRPLLEAVLPSMPVTLRATTTEGYPIQIDVLRLDAHGIVQAKARRLDTRPFDTITTHVPCHGAACKIAFLITDAHGTEALVHTISLAVTEIDRTRRAA